jgi:hypothetical protein
MSDNQPPDDSLSKRGGSSSAQIPERLSGAPRSEDAALALLQSPDVTREALSELARDQVVQNSQKVIFGLVAHPRMPRHLSIPLLRRMFTFDLVRVTLTPTIAADIRRSAEEQIIGRIESLPAGQKISLARRASGRIAGRLLQDPDARVIAPALENRQLTEALVIQALLKKSTPQAVFNLASEHPKWSCRREVQIALLKSGKISPQRVQQFAKNFSPHVLREILGENTEIPPSPGI